MKATDMLRAVRENVVAPAIDGAQRALAPATNARDALRAVSDSPQMAPIHAAFRGGLKDLQDALIPAFPDSMKAREEPGSIASPTQQLVTENVTGRRFGMEMG